MKTEISPHEGGYQVYNSQLRLNHWFATRKEAEECERQAKESEFYRENRAEILTMAAALLPVWDKVTGGCKITEDRLADFAAILVKEIVRRGE